MKRSLTDRCREIAELTRQIGRPIRFMEVCGTHTVSLFRTGVRGMLPPQLKMLSGPGCPVCVTAQRHIDAAIELGTRRNVIIATYGDMLRVPGRLGSLERLRASGASVYVVASARGALELARDRPQSDVVFLAVGFETTAPATAAVIREAHRQHVGNFSALICHKLIVPAMSALLDGGRCAIDGFLCPGHVSVIIGSDAFLPIATRYRKPCVVTGFEPGEMLEGIDRLLRQTLHSESRVENAYPSVVSARGNSTALSLLGEVFEISDTAWRALGVIERSGLRLAKKYVRFDAERRFGIVVGEDEDHPGCRCGEVIQGMVEPAECPLFGRACSPSKPLGPCMVSSEGTCAAWHRYLRIHREPGSRVDDRGLHHAVAQV